MNGFLVLARCGLDDIPMYFCGKRTEAEDFAKLVEPEHISRIASDVFRIDTTVFHAVAIVSFVDGKPVDSKNVKDLDE